MKQYGWRVGALVAVAALVGLTVLLMPRPEAGAPSTSSAARPDTAPAVAESRPALAQGKRSFWNAFTIQDDLEFAVTGGLEGAQLQWRCNPRLRSSDRLQDYRVSWFVVPPDSVEFVGSASADVYVRYQFDMDDHASTLQAWSLGTSGLAIMPERGRRAFARRVADARAVAVEVTDPWDGQVRKYLFALPGFEQALRELSCGRRFIDDL